METASSPAGDHSPLFLPRRPRRLRRTAAIRNLVRETRLSVDQMIYPLFIVPGNNITQPIPAMPEVSHHSVDRLDPVVEAVVSAGVSAVLLFGLPGTKDSEGSEAWSEESVVVQAIRRIKQLAPQLVVFTDVCLCAYTDHGHCGIIEEGRILNDPSVERLARMALAHSHAGADFVAPSDMMDGRIGAIRQALDSEGQSETGILSYAAKYASSFYGPFRDAAHSAPSFGDRRSYQMDPANAREAVLEVALDIQEGADMVMVKPAMPYLDIVRRLADTVSVPVAAYQVSGEYSQMHAAAERGWLDLEGAMVESLECIHRAGANLLITYFALRFAALRKG